MLFLFDDKTRVLKDSSVELTTLLLRVSLASHAEGHHGPEVGAQHGPAEGGHGVDADQASDEGILTALQQRHDVRTHVVSVLLPEVLRGQTQARCNKKVNIFF